MIEVTLVNGPALTAKLNGLASSGIRQALARAIAETTIALHARVVRKLSQPGSGRTYRRLGVSHRASAPGQPPAVDLGAYRASMQPDVSAVQSTLVGTVGPRGSAMQRRGKYLEYGTRNMGARPHLGPSAMEERPLAARRAQAAIGRALAGRGR